MEKPSLAYRDLNDNQMRFIFSTIEDALCITNGKGHILYVNPAAEELLGVSKKGIQKKRLHEVIPFVERNDEFIQTFIDTFDKKTRCRHKLVDYENLNGKILTGAVEHF